VASQETGHGKAAVQRRTPLMATLITISA
jgi:hypothetical protein